MTDLHKLPDEWREEEQSINDPHDPYSHALSNCADELEAALPKWTKITDDPKTWPNDGDWGFFKTWKWYGVHTWFNDEYDNFPKEPAAWWRPLCSLDFPPEVKVPAGGEGMKRWIKYLFVFVWPVLGIAILVLLLSGCSLYMVEPDWETGENGWRYGVDTSVQVGPTFRDFGYESPLDVPVIRVDADGMEKHCGKRYSHGCWSTIDGNIYVPSVIYAGHYEITHERLHTMGYPLHNDCAGIYAAKADKERCERFPLRKSERRVRDWKYSEIQ